MTDWSHRIAFESHFFAGIDVGQVNDSTAIGIVERIKAVPQLVGMHAKQVPAIKAAAAAVPIKLDLVHLDRIPLGTPYPAQVEAIRELLHAPALRGVQSYIDATGVGRPVHQMLKKAGVRDLQSISITASQGEAKQTTEGWNVGKAQLVHAVQIEMQTGRLRFGRRIPNADLLVRELREFRSRQSAAGHISFNAREGQHDDLVLAVAYAVFGALRPRPVTTIDLRFLT
jgi:hypothetical protein